MLTDLTHHIMLLLGGAYIEMLLLRPVLLFLHWVAAYSYDFDLVGVEDTFA